MRLYRYRSARNTGEWQVATTNFMALVRRVTLGRLDRALRLAWPPEGPIVAG